MPCRELRFVLSVVFYVVNENPQNCICSKSCKKQKKTPEIRGLMFVGTQCDLWGKPVGTGHKNKSRGKGEHA